MFAIAITFFGKNIDELTENLRKRYFIKGRPGTGKSTFLKKLSKSLKDGGFDVEEYYCSFDKESLDMVVSRELSFTVFELSDKGELLIDNPQKLVDSEAAFFLFVNPRQGWTFAVKNTLENQKKLIRQEQIQNYKIKIIN